MIGGLAILAVLLWQLGTGAFLDGLRRLDGTTLLAALGLGLLTTVFSAWRWCLVARGLGIRLRLGHAVADYYRSLFLNAALPGGVLGDVHRAVRHGRSSGDVGRGVRAVVLERCAGQGVLVAVGVALLIAQPSAALAEAGRSAWRVVTAPEAVLTLCVAGAVIVPVVLRRRLRPGGTADADAGAGAGAASGGTLAGGGARAGGSRWGRALRTTLTEARLGLLSRRSWPGVVVSSAVVLAGYLGMFLLAARAAGATAPAAELLPLMVLALLAMALPLNVAGWGPREGATAWAFGAAGLGAAQGLTVAVVYGLLSFAASLPGVGVLLAQWLAGLRRPQVEFEERVLAEDGAPDRRAERVAHQFRAGEAETGDAVAEQDRRHGHIEPVQRALVEEPRHGDAAALDQDTAEPAPRQLVHQAAGGERGAVGEDEHIHLAAAAGMAVLPVPPVLPVLPVAAHHPQGGRLAVGEHPEPRWHAAVRVEDDAHRVAARAGADRQPGIVRGGGAGADDHGVGERAQAVQVGAVLLAGDVVGVAGAAGDEPVQALPQLREGEAGTGEAERQIALGEEGRAGRGVRPPAQAVRVRDQSGGFGVRLTPDTAQPLPGF
ncbi:flippase-like domain-containing protein [Streptomyces sp. F63]|nr:flippase-like domain-containing protein [Streptomyces sp. F63]